MSANEKRQVDIILERRGLDFLKCERLYKKDFDEVMDILDMGEWYNPRFQALLHPGMWKRTKQEIQDMLHLKIGAENEIDVWEDERFQCLLVPRLWNLSAEELEEKLNLSYWQKPKYFHLISSGILGISTEKIVETIELFESLGLDDYILLCHMRMNLFQFKALYHYLIKIKMSVIIGVEINPILKAQTKATLLARYGINLDQVMEEERARGHGLS